jgi:hypothetical protein
VLSVRGAIHLSRARAVIEFILTPQSSATFIATMLETAATTAGGDVAIARGEMQLGVIGAFQEAQERLTFLLRGAGVGILRCPSRR